MDLGSGRDGGRQPLSPRLESLKRQLKREINQIFRAALYPPPRCVTDARQTRAAPLITVTDARMPGRDGTDAAVAA